MCVCAISGGYGLLVLAELSRGESLQFIHRMVDKRDQPRYCWSRSGLGNEHWNGVDPFNRDEAPLDREQGTSGACACVGALKDPHFGCDATTA